MTAATVYWRGLLNGPADASELSHALEAACDRIDAVRALLFDPKHSHRMITRTEIRRLLDGLEGGDDDGE